MKRLIETTALAVLLASPALADQWWHIQGDFGAHPYFCASSADETPAALYQRLKDDFDSPNIIDKGDVVWVTSKSEDGVEWDFDYYRTKDACEQVVEIKNRKDEAATAKEQQMLDKYR